MLRWEACRKLPRPILYSSICLKRLTKYTRNQIVISGLRTVTREWELTGATSAISANYATATSVGRRKLRIGLQVVRSAICWLIVRIFRLLHLAYVQMFFSALHPRKHNFLSEWENRTPGKQNVADKITYQFIRSIFQFNCFHEIHKMNTEWGGGVYLSAIVLLCAEHWNTFTYGLNLKNYNGNNFRLHVVWLAWQQLIENEIN